MKTDGEITLNHPDLSLDTAIAASNQIAQRLRSLSSSIGPSYDSVLFYSRVRTKSRSSIREKSARKRRENPNLSSYSFKSMTDLVGFRAVALYDNDLDSLVDFVLSLVRAGQNLTDPLFSPGPTVERFREAKFFYRPENEVYQKCKDYFQKALLSEVPNRKGIKELREIIEHRTEVKKADEELYSSAHFIFNAVSYISSRPLVIPIEFQIRTAVEDFWAEINHKLAYKVRDRYVWSSVFEEKYKSAVQESKKIKSAVDNISPHVKAFSELSSEVRACIKEFSDPSSAEQSLDSPNNYSFCVWLFLHASGRKVDVGVWERLNKYTERLNRITDQDLSRLARSSIIDLYSDSAAAILELKGFLRDLEYAKQQDFIARCEEHRELNVAEVLLEEPIDLTLVREQRRICELEFTRLRANALLFNDLVYRGGEFHPIDQAPNGAEVIVLEGRGKFNDSEISQSENRLGLDVREAMNIYTDLCQHLWDSQYKIVPASMIYFWKHLISGRFDQRMSFSNIEKSYEELQSDKTISQHSIYRVAIPRQYSIGISTEVESFVQRFDVRDGGIGRMLGASREFSSSLAEAVRLSLEAFEINISDKKIRGDFLLTSDKEKSTFDLISIFNYCMIAHKVFGEDIARVDADLGQRILTASDSVSDDDFELLSTKVHGETADGVIRYKTELLQRLRADARQDVG